MSLKVSNFIVEYLAKFENGHVVKIQKAFEEFSPDYSQISVARSRRLAICLTTHLPDIDKCGKVEGER